MNGALFFMSALGAFNGLVIGIYFLFFARSRKISNYFLGALLVALSLRIGKSVLYYFDTSLLKVYLQIGLSACWLIGPLTYYYICTEKNVMKTVPRTWIGTLVSLVVFIVGIGLIFPYQRYPAVWNQYLVQIIYIEWGIFLTLAMIELRRSIAKIAQPGQLKAVEVWLMGMLSAILVIYICYVWALLGHSAGVYISGAIIFSVVLYAAALMLLHKQKKDDLFSPPPARYANKKIKDDDAQLMLGRLERAMIEKRVYKNPNLKLNELATEIHV